MATTNGWGEILVGALEVVAQVGVGFIAGLASGIIAPFVSQAKDRRAARSLVVEKMRMVEGARHDLSGATKFQESVALLHASSTGARLSVEYVNNYLRVARLSYRLSTVLLLLASTSERFGMAKGLFSGRSEPGLKLVTSSLNDAARYLNSSGVSVFKAFEAINEAATGCADALETVVRHPAWPFWYRITFRRSLARRVRNSRQILCVPKRGGNGYSSASFDLSISKVAEIARQFDDNK